MTVSEVIKKMVAYSEGNLHDINHFMKVYAYAKTIAEGENLNPELQKEWDKLINKERYRLHQMLKYIREHLSTLCDFISGIISGFDSSTDSA